MEKLYERINFEDAPSKKTPLNKENMNKMDRAIDEVDNRVIELNHDLSALGKNGLVHLIDNAKMGYYDTSDVFHSSSGICCSLDWIVADYDYAILFPEGYRIGVLTYTDNGIVFPGWKTEPVFIAEGTRYRVSLTTVTQDNITDVSAFIKNFYKTTFISDLEGKIDTKQQTVLLSQTGLYPLTAEFESGQYNLNGEKTSSNIRMRSKGLVSYPFDITVECKGSYQVAILIKSGDTYTSSGFVKTYSIPANSEFLVVARTSPEVTLTDVEECVNSITIGSYAKDNIDKLTERVKRTNQLFITPGFVGVAHRGLSSEAPHNSKAAFVLAKKTGFEWVETDLRWTADNVPVLIHDSFINSTARNLDGSEIASEVNVESTTYAELNQYDYNVINGVVHTEYSGNKLLTLEEALIIWKKLGLKVFIEIKSGALATEANIGQAIALIKKYGFEDNIILSSYNPMYLNRALPYLSRPRFLINVDTVGTEDWNTATTNLLNFKRVGCDVYIAIYHTAINETAVAWATENEIPIVAFTIDSEETILSINPCTTFILSNTLNATEVYENDLLNSLPKES